MSLVWQHHIQDLHQNMGRKTVLIYLCGFIINLPTIAIFIIIIAILITTPTSDAVTTTAFTSAFLHDH